MEIFLKLLAYAEGLVDSIQRLTDFFSTPFTMNFGIFGKLEFASYAEIILGSGLTIFLGFKVWKFFSDGVGL